ncbi:MAG: leucyl/phenylalanyl-tRNA--protein transferase [Methylotenera sp.]|nr:leucyl/phenylalanyl-tRNA--protein transferase [Oligoflexia bacterium]
MAIIRFPDLRNPVYSHQIGPEGIIAVGGNLHPETLLSAYRRGIFPWPMEEYPLCWFSPPERAVLDFDEIHIPRSLRQEMKRSRFKLTLDQAFDEVIQNCADMERPDQDGTWITEAMIEAYCRLHRLGHAHSAEAWVDSPDGPELVGGVYGVDPGGAFAGESMFHTEAYASKLALLHLIEHLRSQGLKWLDIQTLTPHMKALGAKLISRDEFLNRLTDQLTEAEKSHLKLF